MVGWWPFKWRHFMNMVTKGKWGKVKRRHFDVADVRRKE
jgi:hypothetical protein